LNGLVMEMMNIGGFSNLEAVVGGEGEKMFMAGRDYLEIAGAE
jgi:hypothetical protein